MRILFYLWNITRHETLPRHIATSVCLGIFLGFSPLLTPQAVLGWFLFFILRNHWMVTLVAAFFSMLGSVLLTYPFHSLGYSLLVKSPSLHRLWAGLYHSPLFPFTQFNNSVILGELTVFLILCIPIYLVTYQFFKKVSVPLAEWYSRTRLRSSLRFTALYQQFQEYEEHPERNHVRIEHSARGFFRPWGWVVPTGLVAAVALYVAFFLDSQIKATLETYLSQVNGAKVSIKELTTNIFLGKFQMTGLQFAHHVQPSKNILEVDSISARFYVMPLLAGKFVCRDIQVDGVQTGTHRESFGALDSDELVSASGPGLLDRVVVGQFAPLRRSLGDTPLRKLGILTMGLGTQERVEDLKSQLATTKKIEQLRDAYTQTMSQYEKNWEIHQSNQWLTSLEKDLLSPDASKLSSLKESDRLSALRQLQEHRKKAEALYGVLDKELSHLSYELEHLQEPLSHDVQLVRESFGLPKLDGGDFTQALLGPRMLNYLERVGYWVDLSRRRMSTGQDYSGVMLIEQPTSRGTNVHFSKKSTFPKFLILTGAIRSRHQKQENRGEVTIHFENLTTDPPIWRKQFQAKGDFAFPGLGIQGGRIALQLDHTQQIPKEKFTFSVDALPFENWMIEQTSDLSLSVSEAVAKIDYEAQFEASNIKAHWNIRAEGARYKISTRFGLLQRTLEDALAPFSHVTTSGEVQGTFQEPTFLISSNLGESLAQAIQSRLKHSLGAVEDTITQSILDLVEYSRRTTFDHVAESKLHAQTELASHLNSLENLQKKIEQKSNRLARQGTSSRKPASKK